MNITKYEVPTWNQVYDMLLCVAQKIRQDNYKPDVVVGVARGGVIPARVLSDLLEAPLLTTIEVEFYLDIAQPGLEPKLKQALTANVEGKKILVVDDIADTGQSLKLAKIHCQKNGACEIKTATLFRKPQSITTPDYFERITGCWVVFPWEAKETLRKIIAKCEGKGGVNHEIAKLVKAGLPKQLAEKLLLEM